MANQTSGGVLESPPPSDIDAEIERLLSELNQYIQELAQKTKELSEAKDSYNREKEAVGRKRLLDVGINEFDEVSELANVRLQRQDLERRVDEMLSLSDQCIEQIGRVVAAIYVQNKKKHESSSSEQQLVGTSKLGDSSTSSKNDDDDDDDPVVHGQKSSVMDLGIGKEDLENAQAILTAAQQSIQNVKEVGTSGIVNDAESCLGRNRAWASRWPEGENLSEIEWLENRMADFQVEEDEEGDNMENSEEIMDVDSADGMTKLKRKKEEDNDDQKKPNKAMKLKDQNPPASH